MCHIKYSLYIHLFVFIMLSLSKKNGTDISSCLLFFFVLFCFFLLLFFSVLSFCMNTYIVEKEKNKHNYLELCEHDATWRTGSMRRPTGDTEVVGSTPAEVSNILSRRLLMKYFLRSFSPFH